MLTQSPCRRDGVPRHASGQDARHRRLQYVATLVGVAAVFTLIQRAPAQTDTAPVAPATAPSSAPVAPSAPSAAPAPDTATTPTTPPAASTSPPSVPVATADDEVPVSWRAGGAQNLVYRMAPHEMGDNNGVSLWVRGNGSPATLRVRLMTVSADTPADTVTLRPMWRSVAIKVSSTQWAHIVLPRSKFTLHRVNNAPDGLDPELPADAQSGLSVPAEQPKFADANAIALETDVA